MKYESAAGEQLQITSDDVRQYFCSNATEKEVAMFLQLCKAQKLNPFVRDAYLVKYGDAPAQIITGKDVLLKRAQAHPDFQGYESGVTYVDAQGQVQRREGSGVYEAAGETLVGGWCRVYVRDKKPFFDEVSLDEYSTGKSMWKSAKAGGKPATMIRKVALVHVLREAFANDFQGLYAQEELKQVSDAELPEEPIAQPEIVRTETYVTEEQRLEITSKVSELAQMRVKPEAEVMQAIMHSNSLQAAGYVEGDQFTESQAGLAIKLLDNWLAKAYAESEQAAAKAKEQLEANLYDEDVKF